MSLQQRLQRARAEIAGDIFDPVTGMMFDNPCKPTIYYPKGMTEEEAIRYLEQAMFPCKIYISDTHDRNNPI